MSGPTFAGPVRHPRNLYSGSAGSIHDDATATRLGFRGGTVAGSVHLDQFPPTEVLWFDSRAHDGDGPLVAGMRMMLRNLKASSPLYAKP